MKYDDFINNLPIKRTKSGEGKGVAVKVNLYMNKDGLRIISALQDDGKRAKSNGDVIRCPCSTDLEMVDAFIDILYSMNKKVKK